MNRVLIFVSCLSLLALAACTQRPVLERIRDGGVLIVGSRIAPGTVHRGVSKWQGPEYELVRRFARSLGLKLRWKFFDSDQELIAATASGRLHMAAAALIETPSRSRVLRFSTPYDTDSLSLLYRRNSARPREISELPNLDLAVSAHGAAAELLDEQAGKRGWQVQPDTSLGNTDEALVNALEAGRTRYILVSAKNYQHNLPYQAYVLKALDLANKYDIGWAFPRSWDASVVNAANRFLARLRENGELQAVLGKYVPESDHLDYVEKRTFKARLGNRLPKYRDLFIDAAKSIGKDWRLLAAISYQESHWNPKAVSPTGVRGLMMLTRDTARGTGIEKRHDPEQSIRGGARYLKMLEQKLPERITGKDRLWLTLAAYNLGFGHLEDARILTQRQGGSPDRWKDVRSRLSRLADSKYYNTLKNGFARGYEAVSYVDNIQAFYRILVWWDNKRQLLPSFLEESP